MEKINSPFPTTPQENFVQVIYSYYTDLSVFLLKLMTDFYKINKALVFSIQPGKQFIFELVLPGGTLAVENCKIIPPCVLLEKWFPLQGERVHALYFWSFKKQNRKVGGGGDRTINLPKVISPQTTTTPPNPNLYHTQ